MVNDKLRKLEVNTSPLPVVIDPPGTAVVPNVIRFWVGPAKVGGLVVGTTPGFTEVAVGSTPRAINTLPVLVVPVEEAWIVVAVDLPMTI